MGAALLTPVPSTTELHESAALFACAATKNGRVVAELFGFESAETSEVVKVLAEIRHVQAPEDRDPQRLWFAFSDREQSQRFVDETLTAFEYLGCTITRD